MKTILSAVWFALGSTPEVLMLADTLAQRDAAEVETLAQKAVNEVWMVEKNRYGRGVPSVQYVFWDSPGHVREVTLANSVKGRPDGSPWTFEHNSAVYTVHFDKYRETNTLTDPEFNAYKAMVHKREFVADRINQPPPHWPRGIGR